MVIIVEYYLILAAVSWKIKYEIYCFCWCCLSLLPSPHLLLFSFLGSFPMSVFPPHNFPSCWILCYINTFPSYFPLPFSHLSHFDSVHDLYPSSSMSFPHIPPFLSGFPQSPRPETDRSCQVVWGVSEQGHEQEMDRPSKASGISDFKTAICQLFCI